MTPYYLQMLSLPGMPSGLGVMCQHDFEGQRIFQHRNMAKWDLLAENPRIPGYLYEEESREFLKELRALWNGRLNWSAPRRNGHAPEAWRARTALVKELVAGRWLLDDRKPRSAGCCGPMMKWAAKQVSKPWKKPEPPPPAAGQTQPDPAELVPAAMVEHPGAGISQNDSFASRTPVAGPDKAAVKAVQQDPTFTLTAC